MQQYSWESAEEFEARVEKRKADAFEHNLNLADDLLAMGMFIHRNIHVFDTKVEGGSFRISPMFNYDEPADDAERLALREQARVWLGSMLRLPRKRGIKARKDATDYDLGVVIEMPKGVVRFRPAVAAVTACEIVETGEVEEVEERIYPEPVTVTKTRPVTKRVCPPSFLAGTLDEVQA